MRSRRAWGIGRTIWKVPMHRGRIWRRSRLSTRSGCMSTAARGRCNGRPTATPKTCAGRSASTGSRSSAPSHVSWSPRFPLTFFAARCRPLIESFLPDLLSWTSFDIAWAQRYAVTTLCRMLYTLETGEVASKPASLEWAKSALPAQWQGLIQQVDRRPAAPMERPSTTRERGGDDCIRRIREGTRRRFAALGRIPNSGGLALDRV